VPEVRRDYPGRADPEGSALLVRRLPDPLLQTDLDHGAAAPAGKERGVVIGPMLLDMFRAYACTLEAILEFDRDDSDDYIYMLLRREHLDASDDILHVLHQECGGEVILGDIRVTATSEGELIFRQIKPWTRALRGGLQCMLN
jgi:hypothetical protein